MAIRPVREAFDLSGAFYYAWTLPTALLTAICLAGYLGFLVHLPTGSRNRLIQVSQIYVSGAFAIEFIIGNSWQSHGDGFTNGMLNVIQESMAITGS